MFSSQELFSATAEDVFSRLVMRGNGGTRVHSMAAPAMSTQFVKAKDKTRAFAGSEGALAEVIFPSHAEVQQKLNTKHGDTIKLGYDTTGASDVHPAGFGERSAQALSREENTFQLKGTFSQALIAFSKLRARIESREGHPDALDRIFSKLWGIDVAAVEMMPRFHVEGTESTRMAAMEDRAYHALSGHPGHNGGYRIDMATVAPDALGPNVPLNWPRIRTGLKAIALVQSQGDLMISSLMKTIRASRSFSFTMNLVQLSQPVYVRPFEWEVVLDALTEISGALQFMSRSTHELDGIALSATMKESLADRIVLSKGIVVGRHTQQLAKTVTSLAQATLTKTQEVIVEHDRHRLELIELEEHEYDAFEQSELTAQFQVPRYKLMSTTMNRGMHRPIEVRDNLPDIRSRSRPHLQLDLREFREANMGVPVDIPGALNMAIFMTVLNPSTIDAAYMLMHLVPDPRDNPTMKAAVRLRRQHLYRDEQVRRLGPILFGDQFMNTFELLVKNAATSSDEPAIKGQLWEYLSNRCAPATRRRCPTVGGWKDLIIDLRDYDEGWSLYYWVRVSIGKKHHAVSSGILAPLAAGESIDFLTLVKRGIKERGNKWKTYYAAKYKVIEGGMEIRRQRMASQGESSSEARTAKYVPPHLRSSVDLEQIYDADAILNRTGGYEEEEYRQMVEMQSKSKFFAAIETFTHGSTIAVGITDAQMYNMLVEFYQARWYSLHKRIERARSRGLIFRLGHHEFPEHPWGELCTELPDNYLDMLSYMSSLDERAWTLPPGYLQEKFRKSIEELWADISEEISMILQFIENVYDGLVEEQEDVDAARGRPSVLRSLSGVPAIPIPSSGYTPPHLLPAKPTTAFDPTTGASIMVPPRPMTYTAVAEEEFTELDDLDLEDATDYSMDYLSTGMSDHIEIVDQAYLTYNQIWEILGLPDKDDPAKRLAFGLPADLDLDSQHVDPTIGPTHTTGEAGSVTRKWSKKLEMMRYRLKMPTEQTPDQDM